MILPDPKSEKIRSDRIRIRIGFGSDLHISTYDILFDLCSPNSPSSKSFADLKTILKSHFASKRLTIAERYRFHNCTQTESESVSEFAANLKKLASTCDFGMLYAIVLCVAYEVQACKRNC